MSPSPSQPNDPTASHLTEVEFEIRDPAYFFVGLSETESCRVRLEEMIHLADGTLIEFFTGEACSRTAIRERADDVPAIDSANIVHEGRDGVLFRLTISGRCIVETIEGAGGIPESVTAIDGTGHVTAQVPRGVDSADVVAAVLDTHQNPEFAAHRQRDASTPAFSPWGVRQVLRERATDRQWEVLRTAYRHGYFDRPREHSGEEIAEMLDISSATFSQHLRTALYNVLSVAIEDSPSDRSRRTERR
jgi:predicted DNA binding protein